ncbi:MAG TPA: GNAT family N-acetyltransferase [Pyrinomonadaceae bacterium]|jgi:RimJ/RimL family protein N-acetyltransferase|nr:GNAT family N-acetyltransferase [Pyrinomonadaceae bacterium]
MIETGNLKLVACTRMHLQGMQRTEMPSMMGADTVEGWLAFPESVQQAIALLQANSQNLRWGMHIVLHKTDNKIIGTCGYNGAADNDGLVEIGYAVAPSYKNTGIESEIAKGLVDNAFEWAAVNMIDAYTLARSSESGKTLEGLGFARLEKEEGLVHWRLTRNDYENSRAN